ncbi:MAG: aspartate aminotransferase family protein, partial [Oscillospiraceae bacterium]|nr:aspartate aminotransferase family protein [Oscillospiraceae bacterium]
MTETTANIVTAVPGPKSLALLARRTAAVPRGVSHSTEIFAAEAKGALIKDVDGNTFIDFAAGIGVINTGHCADEVVAAINAQSASYIHTSINVAPYEPYVELAERLNALAPVPDAKTMFVNSGAEAVENAVKIAKKFTGRTGIVTVDGSFHGRTLLTMSLTTKVKPYKDGFGPFVSDTYKIPCPNLYRNDTGLSDDEFALKCADEFAFLLRTSLSPEMVACVIIEPVQGEGGFIPMPVPYIRRIREICDANGIVLIIDEIQSGIARTGTLFAIEQYGVEPDLLTSSKSLAAGLPLSAVIGRADIMEAPQVGGIGGTFAGNPVACAAALAVLGIVEKCDLNAKARALGEYLISRLREIQAKYDVVGDVRGLGAMLGMELVTDRETKEPNRDI